MSDAITIGLAIVTGVLVPAVGWVVSRVVALGERCAKLEAEATVAAEQRGVIQGLAAEVHALALAVRSLEAKISTNND